MNLPIVPFCSHARKPHFPQVLEKYGGTTRLEPRPIILRILVLATCRPGSSHGLIKTWALSVEVFLCPAFAENRSMLTWARLSEIRPQI